MSVHFAPSAPTTSRYHDFTNARAGTHPSSYLSIPNPTPDPPGPQLSALILAFAPALRVSILAQGCQHDCLVESLNSQLSCRRRSRGDRGGKPASLGTNLHVSFTLAVGLGVDESRLGEGWSPRSRSVAYASVAERILSRISASLCAAGKGLRCACLWRVPGSWRKLDHGFRASCPSSSASADL